MDPDMIVCAYEYVKKQKTKEAFIFFGNKFGLRAFPRTWTA